MNTTTKIVYNDDFGGFGLSDKAIKRYAELKDVSPDEVNTWDLSRTDPILVQVVEELGQEANGMCACLKIAELPKGCKYRITEYDGAESIDTPEDY